MTRKATFITAPAGYGKTTLVGDWARQLNVPVGWLSLDDKDNDLIRFWKYVTKAVEQALGSLSDQLHSAVATISPGQYEPFLVALLNELNGLQESFALVLDDWHVIDDKNIITAVSYFLEYLPSSVHICFASRTAAKFQKARWISREWIHEVRIEHLRFDLRETVDFFRICVKKELRREQIEHFLHKTEGWVTGLRLVSLYLRNGGRPAEFIRRHTGDSGRIEQFLLEEVFEALDESTQQFLMNVSILQRMNGPLCEAVAGRDGTDKLAELAGINLFLIPLDDNREWYRFHHLFGEFLQQQQRRHSPDQTKELHRAAAVWCESQGLMEEAIDYYLAGHGFTEAIRLLEQMRSIMIRREFSTLRVWLSAIPEQLLMQHPYLYFSYIFSLLWAHDLDMAERHLQLAEQYYETSSANWSQEAKNRYLGYLYYVMNFKATQYDMDMVKGLHYIRLSLQHSPTGTDLIFASPHMPLCPSIYRSYNGKRGKHLPRGLSDTFFLNMIEFMTPMGLQHSILVCYGELMYERNELEQAEHYLKLGLQGQGQTRYQPEKVYVPAYHLLSRISKIKQDIAQAEKWLEEAGRKAMEDGVEAASILIEAEKAALRLDLGDSAAAVEWQERYRISAHDPVSVYQLFVYIFLVRVLVETDNVKEAWALSEKLLLIAVKGHRPMDALEIQVLQATSLRLMGKPEQALLKLEEVLQYAEPDDYIRVFVDKGKPVAELLIEYVQQRLKGNIRDKNAPSLVYVRKILSCYGGEGVSLHPSEAALETLLTQRELMIFRCMEEGMGNTAISESLGIGKGTLKAHINRIYSKLQVTNRVEAINRGKEMQG
ncbi:LuxR C-terminal-related transcriptional regulator [Cohnella suwonensis]|uniref:LuxR C-terminal-related transcriptional regulator n=1 Tax=Cohnella suwonensis TaxID=696072 RepID=A0ABW0LYA3_9BACL